MPGTAMAAVSADGSSTTNAIERLHEEFKRRIKTQSKAFIRKWRLKHRAVADSLEEAGDRLFAFTRLPPSQWRSAR